MSEHNPLTEESDAWAYAAFADIVQGKAPDSASDKTAAVTPPGGRDVPPSTGDDKAPASTDNGHIAPSTDPLSGLTLDDLLKHQALGPTLNSWADKIANSRLAQERPRIESQLEPQVRASIQDKEDREYLRSLTPDQRGQALATDQHLAALWGRMSQEAEQVSNSSPESVARAAQVYAMATEIAVWDKRIDDSSLPEAEKTALKDTTSYASKGAAGLQEWTAHVLDTILTHDKEAGIQSELETRWASYQEEQKALSSSRPNLSPSGRRSEPAPDVRESSSDAFLAAFS